MNRHIWLTRRSRINRKLEVKIRAGIKRLREEMAEISGEQKCIEEWHRQVREKFDKIEAEQEQGAGIQVRLGLMVGIVKARAQNDYDLATQLTQSLRDLLAMQNEKCIEEFSCKKTECNKEDQLH